MRINLIFTLFLSIVISACSKNTQYEPRVGKVVPPSNVTDKYCYDNNGLDWTDYDRDGAGTIENTYKICTVAQLHDLANHTDSTKISNAANDKHFDIRRDVLDAAAYISSSAANEFIIAENALEPFIGTINGNGHEIKGFTSSKPEVALIKYMNGGSIKNLKYSYSLMNTSSTSVGGLIYEIGSSANDVLIDKITLTADIKSSNNQVMMIGALVKTAKSNSKITISNIEATINIQAKGSIAGLVNEIQGLSTTKPLISKVSVSGDFKILSSLTNSQATFSGLIESAQNVNISDVHTNILASNGSIDMNKFTGGVGFLLDSSVDNAFSLGTLSIHNIQKYGGLVTEQTNSQIRNSFSLMNASGNDCSSHCGSVLGQTNGGVSTLMTNLYKSNQTLLSFTSISGANTIVENSADTIVDSQYFHTGTNLPLSNWNFLTIWQVSNSTYPSLR